MSTIYMRGDAMVDGNKLGDVGFKYLGVPYSTMDCQAFVEKCLQDCGENKNLAGSNAWFREVNNNGVIMTPEECVRELGTVPKGAFLFILKQDGGEPAKYKPDGLGNASHIGLCTGSRGEGAIHSSQSRGCVAESKFKNKTINGGWNRVGLWNKVAYDYGGQTGPLEPVEPTPSWRATIRRGSRGEDVTYCQDLLMANNYDVGASGADGVFGRKTEEAVKAFQRDHGLNPDGVVGPLTWDALQQEPSQEPEIAPSTGLYTVTIKYLTKDQADALKERYNGAVTIEEET